MEKLGVKETKEAMVAVLLLASMLVKKFKDGAQVQDFQALYEMIFKDEAVRNLMLAAYENWDKIPEEVKDIDYKEAIELVTVAAPELLKLIEALKE